MRAALLVLSLALAAPLWAQNEEAAPPEPPPPPTPTTSAEAPGSSGESMMTVDPGLQLDHANHYYSREDYKHAMPEYLKFLSLFPNHPQVVDAHYRLAECYREIGEKGKAEEEFVLVIKRFPNTEFEKRSVYRLGEMRYSDGRYPETVEILSPLLTQKNASSAVKNGAAFYVAKALAEQKKWPEAEKVLAPVSKSKDLRELAPYILELTGRIYRAQGKNKEALAVWQDAMKEKVPASIDVDLPLEIAAVQLELGDPKGAFAVFSKLQGRELAEGYIPAVYVGLLRSGFQSGEYKKVAEIGGKLYEKLPAYYRAEASYLIASANKKACYWAPAIEWFEKHLTEFPNSPFAEYAAYDALACYAAIDDEAKLQAAAQKFLEAHPDSSMAMTVHFMLAESCFKEKKFADALPHYELVGAKGETEDVKADALYKRAWCLHSMGEKAKGQKAFVEFADAYPKSANADDALYLAASLASEQGKWDEAAKTLTRLLTSFPDNTFNTALFELAVAQGHLNDYTAMEQSLKSFLEKYPKHPRQYEAYYWLGWIETGRKNWEGALKNFNEAVKKEDSPFYEEIRLRRATVYYYLNRPADAQKELAFFDSRGKLKSLPLEVVRWTAQSQLDGFHYGEAIDAYRWYLECAKSRAQITDAQMGLARAHAGKGNWNEAIASYKKVIAAEGNTEMGIDARLGAARAIIEKGTDLDPAQKLVNEVLTQCPEGALNAQGRLLQGDLLIAQKKYKDAAAEYYTVGLLFDDKELSPWALKLAAEAFERAGDMAEGQRVRGELAKKYPDAHPETRPASAGGKPKPTNQ